MKPETAEFFVRSKKEPGGLDYRCKECAKAYRSQNKDKLNQYVRNYQQQNRDEINHKQRVKHAKPESKRQRREYDAQNRPRKREYARGYTKRWRAQNPEAWRNRKRIETHRRRALKRSAPGFHTMADIFRQYEKQSGKCAYCQCDVCDNYHIDHVLALCNGGSNDPDNLVVACPSCNMQKGAKLLRVEWCPPNPMPGII